MKKLLALLAVFVLIPIAVAETRVGIDISKNDIVTESFNTTYLSTEEYDSFEFVSVTEPLSIIYDGSFDVKESDGAYYITFNQGIKKGYNSISFSILYDNLIQPSGKGKVIRTSLSSETDESIYVDMKLPEGYFLSGSPSASPSPESISSDGRKILLKFEVASEEPIVVFYETNKVSYSLIIVVVAVLLLGGAAYIAFSKRKSKQKLESVLSGDEKKVLDEISSGNQKQKDIAAALGFSKSKMSKVVRKLEEKSLVERTPHFKTNLLKIKK